MYQEEKVVRIIKDWENKFSHISFHNQGFEAL